MFPDPSSPWGNGVYGAPGATKTVPEWGLQGLKGRQELKGLQGCRGSWQEFPHAWLGPAVSGGSVEAEQGLQARFRAVLRWPQGRAPLHLTTSLQLGLVLGFVSLVLLLLLLL